MEILRSEEEPKPNIENIVAGTNPKRDFERAVWDRARGRCSNCGGEDRLRVRMIVPEEAGGQLVESNGALLCRPCELAADTARPGRPDDKRPINFWVSQGLYATLQNGVKSRHGFTSMASLVRFLMAKYVEDEARFDDLEQYQDAPGADVKVNVWVEADRYATFKALVDKRGLSVTDAIKALIKMYEDQADKLVRRRDA
jgi:hypothetical protein